MDYSPFHTHMLARHDLHNMVQAPSTSVTAARNRVFTSGYSALLFLLWSKDNSLSHFSALLTWEGIWMYYNPVNPSLQREHCILLSASHLICRATEVLSQRCRQQAGSGVAHSGAALAVRSHWHRDRLPPHTRLSHLEDCHNIGSG